MEKVASEFGVNFGKPSPSIAHCRHLIPSLRCSSNYSRRQILTAALIHQGEERLLHLSKDFYSLFRHAIKKGKESWAAVELCGKNTGLKPEEIEVQSKAMKAFYSAPPDSTTGPHYDDDICETLMVSEELCRYISNLFVGAIPLLPNAWKDLRELVAAQTDGRIDPATTPKALDERLTKLLALAGQKSTDWVTKDGEYTPHFRKCQQRQHLRALKLVKYEIWQVLVQRRSEHDRLHGSSLVMQGISQ